jgi:hypothetical protein
MDDDALIELIRANPADAAEALIAIQPDTDTGWSASGPPIWCRSS